MNSVLHNEEFPCENWAVQIIGPYSSEISEARAKGCVISLANPSTMTIVGLSDDTEHPALLSHHHGENHRNPDV